VEHQLEYLRGLVRVTSLEYFYCEIDPVLTSDGTERGVEKHVELDNLSATDVESKVALLLGS